MKKLYYTVITAIIFSTNLHAASYIVNTPDDPNYQAGGSGTSLRAVLNTINSSTSSGDTITFNLPSNSTIHINGLIPLLNLTTNTNNLVIDGFNGGNTITIDGGGTQRGFYARQGNVTIKNINIANTFAGGGDGGTGLGGGGGGLGAGAALFIDSANVTLSNVTMNNNTVKGGNGGSCGGGSKTGGGGGMGGIGYTGEGFSAAGGGGLGTTNPIITAQVNGGGGIGPQGETDGTPGGAYGASRGGDSVFGYYPAFGGANGGGGASSAFNNYGGGGGGDKGSDGTPQAGGNGGYGGGGGGANFFTGGSGGFGGGGGAVVEGTAGDGGFGGGGGGNLFGQGGNGGFGAGAGSGTSGTTFGGEGGGSTAVNSCPAGAGAAMGGAIFINSTGGGTLTVSGPMTVENGTVIAGSGGNGAGAAVSTGIFTRGEGPVIFAPGSGELVTINDIIGDNNNYTMPGGTYTPGAGSGSQLLKNGAGTLNIIGAQTYIGDTTVNAGVMIITGSIPGNANIQSHGTYQYFAADIGGNVKNRGTVTAGSPTAVLNIGGNYEQTGIGVFEVEINDLGQSSLISAAGTATLAGTLSIVESSGKLFDIEYQILHADGGVLQEFTKVIGNTDPTAQPVVRYDNNDVYLSFKKKLPTIFADYALTRNEIAVAAQLSSITNPNECQSIVLDTLNSLGPEQARAALNAISGEQYTYLLQIDRCGNERFNRRIYNALRYTLVPCLNSYCCNSGLETWFQVEVGKGSAHKDANCDGLTGINQGYSIGAFQSFCNNFLIGVAANYQIDKNRFKQGGHTDRNSTQGAIYGTFQNEIFYGFSDVIIGQSWGNFKRRIEFSEIDVESKSKPKTHQGMFYGELGLNFDLCGLFLQPFIAYEYAVFKQSSICERGADCLDMKIHKNNINTNDQYLGVHITSFCQYLTASVDLAWQHRGRRSSNMIRNKFQEFGTAFTIEGVNLGKEGFKGALNIGSNINDNINIYASFNGERWSRWQTYGIDLGVNICW